MMEAKNGNCHFCHHRKTVVNDTIADGHFVCGDCLKVLYGVYQKGLEKGMSVFRRETA